MNFPLAKILPCFQIKTLSIYCKCCSFYVLMTVVVFLTFHLKKTDKIGLECHRNGKVKELIDTFACSLYM